MRTIVIDLERLGFKSFWLEEKLPVLKRRTFVHYDLLSSTDVVAHVNSWIIHNKIATSTDWYVLAYNGEPFNVALNCFNLIDLQVEGDFFEMVITYLLQQESYSKQLKHLKAPAKLKEELKQHPHRKKYRSVGKYVEMCLKMALNAYLLNDFEGEEKLAIPEDYGFSKEVYDYFVCHRKSKELTIEEYITKTIKHFSA